MAASIHKAVLRKVAAPGSCWLKQGRVTALGSLSRGGMWQAHCFSACFLSLLVNQARGLLEPHRGSSFGINSDHVPFPSLLTGYKEQGIPQQL